MNINSRVQKPKTTLDQVASHGVAMSDTEPGGTPKKVRDPSSASAIGVGIGKTLRNLMGRKAPLLDRFAFFLVGVLLLVALFGPLLAPYDPFKTDGGASLKAPSAEHWMGTDDVGRDVFSRMLEGTSVTLFVAVLIVLVATLVGVAVASFAAISPRWLDEAIMRVCEIFMSLPSLVLALGVAAALGPSLSSIVIAMIAALWPSTARLARGIIRETMTSTYAESARVLGVSKWRLMIKHVLPNSLDAVYVHASTEIAGTIVLMSGLAFLGAGAPPPSPDWGSMIAQGKDYITNAWWVALFPGLGITLGAVAFGVVGDAVRAMVDPASRRL